MNVGREEFIASIVNSNGFTLGAELGVWRGRTFLYLVEHCPTLTLVGVDTWSVRPENNGIEGGETYEGWPVAENEGIVRKGAEKYGSRSIILKMDTKEAHKEVGELDFIFIDAGHDSISVRLDIENWYPKVRPGGYIIGHDWDWPTVKAVAQEFFTDIKTGPDNVWFSQLPA